MKQFIYFTLALVTLVAISLAPIKTEETSTPVISNCSAPDPYPENVCPVLFLDSLTELIVFFHSLKAAPEDANGASSIYQFVVKDLDGNDVSLDKYK